MDIKGGFLNTNKQGTKCATKQAHNLLLEIEIHSQECGNNVTTNYLTVCHQAWREFALFNCLKIDRKNSCLSEATLDVCHCHGSCPSRPKHIPKETLRQSLCPCVKVPFHEIPLPKFLKLGK